MIPNVWVQNACFVKRLLHDVDMQIVEKLIYSYQIQEFGIDEHFINEDKFHEIRQLKKIDDVQTALFSKLYDATPDFPFFTTGYSSLLKVALDVAFEDPALPYLKSLHRLLFTRPLQCATIFALSMIRFADDIEACKTIIKKNVLEIEGMVLLALIPKVVQTAIFEDREFLKDVFKGFPGIGIRLPDNLRYEEHFIKLTIINHPIFMQGYDAERLAQNQNMVDLAIATEKTAAWMFKNLPNEDRESAKLVKKTMRDEQLSIQTRRQIFRDLPEIVKSQKWFGMLSTELFGRVFSDDNEVLDDPVIMRILKIAHDNHSSKNVVSSSNNTAYLRSLHIDIQNAFLPSAMKEALKINPKTAESLKTYTETEITEYAAESKRLENLQHSQLLRRYEYLNELTDAVSSIITPRRRDGSYPSSYFSENFEGILVKFSDVSIGPDQEREMKLTTMSGKAVSIPHHWKAEFDDFPIHLAGFWGKLHAGYGQLKKATMLKNGSKYVDATTAAQKAAEIETWKGVSIKVYGTYDYDGKCGIFPNRARASDHLSFVEVVETLNIGSEIEVVKIHRESINKGGLGVAFRDFAMPLKLIALDAGGYTFYVQQIVDFLTKYPLAALSAYFHKYEDDEDDKEDNETDKQDFANIVDEVTKSMIVVSNASRKRSVAPKIGTSSRPAIKRQAIAVKSKPTPKAVAAPKVPDSDSDDDGIDDVTSSDDDGVDYTSSEDDDCVVGSSSDSD